MNTFSIVFRNYGIDINLFNQFGVFMSYRFVGIVALTVVILRARKMVRDNKRAGKAGK